MSRLNKYFLKKTLKAFYISIIIIIIILLLLITSSTSYTKTATKSIAAFFDRVPLYYRLNSPEVIVI
jgi:cell shape-determining protein MreC